MPQSLFKESFLGNFKKIGKLVQAPGPSLCSLFPSGTLCPYCHCLGSTMASFSRTAPLPSWVPERKSTSSSGPSATTGSGAARRARRRTSTSRISRSSSRHRRRKQARSDQICKAFGHTTDPRQGPHTVKYGLNCKKIQAAGKALSQFSRKTGTAQEKENWNRPGNH